MEIFFFGRLFLVAFQTCSCSNVKSPQIFVHLSALPKIRRFAGIFVATRLTPETLAFGDWVLYRSRPSSVVFHGGVHCFMGDAFLGVFWDAKTSKKSPRSAPRSRTCRDVRMALASGKTTPTMERFAMKITETPITVSLQDH